MKRILALLFLATSALGAGTNTTFQITWTPSPTVFLGPTNVWTAPDGYNVWASGDITVPLSAWTLLVTLPARTVGNSTNYIAVTNTILFTTISPPIFFAVTYSNMWGVSPSSGLALAPGYPVNPTVNGLTKGL